MLVARLCRVWRILGGDLQPDFSTTCAHCSEGIFGVDIFKFNLEYLVGFYSVRWWWWQLCRDGCVDVMVLSSGTRKGQAPLFIGWEPGLFNNYLLLWHLGRKQ